MDLEVISTVKAPAAIGPYSQAIAAGDHVYVSGQIPLDPESGEMIEGGIEAQTRRVMDSLVAILEQAGAALNRVVRCTIYLVSLDDYNAVNAIYGEYFSEHRPARVTIQVAALPRGSRVEIDAVAMRG